MVAEHEPQPSERRKGGEMRHLKVLLLIVAISCIVVACSFSGGGDKDSDGDGVATTTVSGTVLDLNDNPIAGAEVTISDDHVTVTTDASGFFSFTVEVGNHEIVIKKNSAKIFLDLLSVMKVRLCHLVIL
jgi:hypothetical protein